MSDRLQRILDLSKRTGDTVVIHDASEPHDLVVLPFDRYEDLVSVPDCKTENFDEYLLEEMSERELIDKINRDIAIWRSYQELNDRDRRAALIEDQLVDDPLADPFEEDFSHRSDWHRVGELVDKRVSRVEDRVSDESEESLEDPIQTYTPVDDSVVHPRQTREVQGNSSHIPLEPVATDTIFEDESELEGGDDPVFFEEPLT